MTTLEFNNSLLVMRPKLQGFAMKLTSDYDKAFDLVQDTYLKAIVCKDQFTVFTNLQAWVFTIMKNIFINNYRRKLKENAIINSTRNLSYYNMIDCKGSVSPESIIAEGEIEMTVDSMINEFRVPFRMHIDGYKYNEISDELGLKLGTVKSRIFLSRKKLMKQLQDYSG
jgi:RNA polymerase sigma-70 factor (ECF subfamily)